MILDMKKNIYLLENYLVKFWNTTREKESERKAYIHP